MRKYFDLVENEKFILEVGDNKITFVDFRDASEFAHVKNMRANIYESVRQINGRFFWLTIVGDEDQISAFGIRKGWYVTEWITEEHAHELRSAWKLLTEQPDNY